MPSDTSSTAVLRTPLFGSHPGAAGSLAGDVPPAASRAGTTAVAAVIPSRRLGRTFTALGDCAGILAVGFAFPLVILAVGIPVVLLIRLAIWAARALSGW